MHLFLAIFVALVVLWYLPFRVVATLVALAGIAAVLTAIVVFATFRSIQQQVADERAGLRPPSYLTR